MSTHDAALGSRPRSAYVEHKQNRRPGCRGIPQASGSVRAQDQQPVSIRLWSNWVEPMSNTDEQIATILARYGEPA